MSDKKKERHGLLEYDKNLLKRDNCFDTREKVVSLILTVNKKDIKVQHLADTNKVFLFNEMRPRLGQSLLRSCHKISSFADYYNQNSELRNCVKIEVAYLGFPVSVGRYV